MSDPRITMSPLELETHLKLVKVYNYFARHIQKIEPKDIEFTTDDEAVFEALWRDDSTAGMVPFVHRPGQCALDLFVQQQMREWGFVAAALVKPRQVGWSAFIQGLLHWLCTKTPGLKGLIISHTKESTGKFLRRLRKMCAAAPDTVTPGRPLENTKEIGFANGAYISVATAGSPDAVRSDNAHFVHASEETSWDQADEVWTAVLPALSFARGSYNFRETTSKGRNTSWHNFIVETLQNKNKDGSWTIRENRWRVFFDPYFNDPRYQQEPPPGWEPNDEEREHARQHLSHLSEKQQLARLFWRRLMTKDLKAAWRFKQEFPSTIDESFQSSENTLYKPDAVYRARANGRLGAIAVDPFAPLVVGVDPARSGDRTVIVFRQGNVILEYWVYNEMTADRLLGILAPLCEKGFRGKVVRKMFVDYAMGGDTVDALKKLGYFMQAQAVHFGESASDAKYLNKRIEMYMAMRDWFGDTGEYVSIPDSDELSGDLLAIPDFVETSGAEKLKLKSKEEIKNKYGKSPDIADACALTFAFPVAGERVAEIRQTIREQAGHLKGSAISRLIADFG